MDQKWWNQYADEARRAFSGGLFTVHSTQVQRVTRIPRPFTSHGNSGAGAIAMAELAGASRIILLGYDCQATNGMTHWHGSHIKPLGDAGSLPRWPEHFSKLAERLRSEVINCTRQTALQVFRRANLEDVLCQ